MAKSVVTHLKSNTDTDFKRVFEKVFNTKVSDDKPAVEKVLQIMTCIRRLKQAPAVLELQETDVRIYRDEDVLSGDEVENAVINRWKRRGEGKEGYIDDFNGIVEKTKVLGCHNDRVAAATFSTPSRAGDKND
ncbi:hypothetical protein G7Y89_g7586 [Cudoniella acicularis]|uniref:Uncharacterized protein n=1 Tax=Cudoniella acicularis TaxID=354080 RepID=A0A8H4RKI0_9HELO|nr:hypothetical protein G7Y89_g7586 [Cudoniella acicularis]